MKTIKFKRCLPVLTVIVDVMISDCFNTAMQYKESDFLSASWPGNPQTIILQDCKLTIIPHSLCIIRLMKSYNGEVMTSYLVIFMYCVDKTTTSTES